MRYTTECIALVAVGVCLWNAVAHPSAKGGPRLVADTATTADWTSYGHDLSSTKYSPLDQIDRTNVASLKIAWRWSSIDGFLSQRTPSGGEWSGPAAILFDGLLAENPRRWRTSVNGPTPPTLSNMKVTPIVANGVMYLNTALGQGAAIDARSGQTLWSYNPKSYEVGTSAMNMMFNVRGVSYWSNGREARIFWGTADAWLVCVAATTGRPCSGFGTDGRVDLYAGLPRGARSDRDYLNAMLLTVSSPPLVIGNTVVVGSAISDHGINKEGMPGWVRAYDAVSGRLKWVFKTIPEPGEVGSETWRNDSWAYSGNTNVWAPMIADPDLGYVYLPTSTPTNDYYGGHRPGNNLFAESLVCVNAETGKRVWHFQAVHHGVWDYDLPAAPNLIDVTVDGRPIKAVAQVSKQGFLYVLDRATGVPVWPIVERAVSTDSNLEGEELSPTQPFPSRPPPFEYQGVTTDDLIDFTPELRREAIDAIKGFRIGPLFTPPMRATPNDIKGTIFRPGTGGGANWSGAGVDPDTGILYVPSRNAFSINAYFSPSALGGTARFARAATAEAERTPGFQRFEPSMPDRLPLFKPPYSRMTAINLNTGEHVWMVPTGGGDRVRGNSRLRHLNLPPVGGDGGMAGPLVTKTLLLYPLVAGGTSNGPRLVAYDKASGAEVGWVALPTPAIGTPMTYMIGGRQYIAIAVRGAAVPEIVTFALP
jgi:quinoprotein glucose dehydrogenase